MLGAAGLSGGSGTSVTVIVSVCLAVDRRPPVPLVALTTTMYSLLRAALLGDVLAASVGLS